MSAAEPLRLKAKVYTDALGRRYMAALGAFREHSQRVHLFAMSDENTLEILITAEQWNALPFFYFKEDGEAPRHKTWLPDPEDH